MSVHIAIIGDDHKDILLLTKLLNANFKAKISGIVYDDDTIVISMVKHAFTLINNYDNNNNISVKEILNKRNDNISKYYKFNKNKNRIRIKYEDVIQNYYTIIKLLIGKVGLVPINGYKFKCIDKKEINIIDPLYLEKYTQFKIFDSTENDKIVIPDAFKNITNNEIINHNIQNININLILEKKLNYYSQECLPDVCFFHIEDCIDSSLCVSLYDYYKNIYSANDIFLSTKYNLNLNDENDLMKIRCYNNNFKALLCHCSYNKKNVTDMFSKNCYSITCLRDPIKKFISHYYHFTKNITNKYIYELSHGELKNIINDYSKNIMRWRLSGETDNIYDALDNITTIKCILIAENIETDIKYLNKILNKKYNITKEINFVNNIYNVENHDYEYIKKTFISEFTDDFFIYNTALNMNIEDRIKA